MEIMFSLNAFGKKYQWSYYVEIVPNFHIFPTNFNFNIIFVYFGIFCIYIKEAGSGSLF